MSIYNLRSQNYVYKEKKIKVSDLYHTIPKQTSQTQLKYHIMLSYFGNSEITIPQLDKDGKKIEPPRVADYITFPVPNINDKETLITMAEDVYEEMSRQQIEGSLMTFEMEIPEEVESETNFGTVPVKFSRIRNGTAIKIYLSQDEIAKISSTSTWSEKRNFLIARGYPLKIAEAFAESLNRINTAFYVKNVTYEIDQENGFQMNLDFINFIDLDSSLLGNT